MPVNLFLETAKLSLYLLLADWKSVIPSTRKVYVEYKQRILNHSWLKDVEKQGEPLSHDNF